MADATDFRKALVKIMPGYNWTVHKSNNAERITATGIRSSGFNRLSTLQITRFALSNGAFAYEAKSAGYGTKSPWMHTSTDETLARALRGLQEHYQRTANTYRALAADLQAGREAPPQAPEDEPGVCRG